MTTPTRQTLKKAIAPASAVAFVCLGCLGSILYVNEANPKISENNHWLNLDQEESKYSDISNIALDTKSQTIAKEMRPRARQLAMIYRQQGKQEKAAEIYRKLWVCDQSSPSFADDARELASIYTDMSAFPSAVESYQKILQYDRDHLQANDPGIARDLNNLGECYYTAGCATADRKKRHQYFIWAKEQLDAAKKMTAISNALSQKQTSQIQTDRLQADQTIIELNKKLVESDLQS